MRKVISLLLSLVMLISVFSIAVTADTAVSSVIEYDEAENFAFSLGVADKASYEPNAYLTRAEFCSLVYRFLTAGEEKTVVDSWQEDNFGEDTKDELVVLGDTKIFDDVDIALPQYEAIKYMVSNGYMNGMTQNHFGPGYDITVASAAKVMVSILGYDIMAVNNGGFPAGYIYAANRTKILSGISSGANDFITTRECLQMFYNCLDVKLFELDYISAEGEVFVSKGEDSFLTAVLGFVRIEGAVEDTGITTLYGNSKVGEDCAIIDGVTVNIGNCTEIRSYIGRTVSAYCKYNDGNYTLYSVHVEDDDTVTFDAKDFVSFQSGSISYADENGKIRKETTVSKNKLKVVYNGKALSAYTDDIFTFPYGDITLVSTGSGAYDLVVIRDYMTARVSGVKSNELYVSAETLYSTMNKVKYLKLDSDEKAIGITNADGSDATFADITKGSVISVLMSEDGEYVEVIISKSVVSGFVIATISETDSDIIYTNDTEEYALSCKDKLTKEPAIKLNEAYNMYLDHKGRLVYLDLAGTDTSDEKAAFITGVDSSSNAFDTHYKIRLYTEEGLMVIYDFDERVILNGDSRKVEDIISEIQKAADAQKAILYEADVKTKIIKSITLPLEFGADDPQNRGWYHISPDEARLSLKEGEEATDDDWKENIDTYGLKWFVNGYTFGRLMFWDKKSTKTMSVPSYVTDYADERNFMVSSGTAPFGNTDVKFLVHGYSRDPKAMAADLLVYASAEQGAEKVVTTSFFVLEKITNALDRDGESVKQLTGYEVVLSPSTCKKVSYTVDDNTYFSKLIFNQSAMGRLDPEDYDIKVDGPAKVSDLEPGDILRFSKSANGVLRSVFVNYDESQNLSFSRTPISYKAPFEGEINMHLGYPLYTSGTYIRMADIKYLPEDMEQSTENLLDPTKLMAHNVDTKPVVVVEKIGGRTVLRQGTMDDIVTYDDTGVQSKYSKVAGVLYGGLTIGTVVYKVTE